MNTKAKRCIRDLIIFIILVILDQWTKYWAVQRLMGNDGIPLIKGVLELYYLPNGNTGAAFGMLSGHKWLFLLIALVVVVVIAYIIIYMPAKRKFLPMEILLVFIAAGGAGNMIDRFIRDYVVDFIYISCINFPIFNVADMYVSVCTVILALIVLFRVKEEDYTELEEALAAPFKKNKRKTDR